MFGEGSYPTIRIHSSEIRYGLQPSDPKSPHEMESAANLSESPPVTFGIDLIRGTTERHFGEVEIRATNTADEGITARFGVTPPFSSYVGGIRADSGAKRKSKREELSDPENRLYLLPVGATDSTINDSLLPDSTSDGLWRIETHIDIPQVGHRRTLAPDETLSRTYAVLAPSQHDLPPDEVPPNSCGLLSGKYAFEEEYAVLKSGPETQNGWIRWEFVIEISK